MSISQISAQFKGDAVTEIHHSSKRGRARFASLLSAMVVALSFTSGSVLAEIDPNAVDKPKSKQDDPIHWSGNSTKWNRKLDQVELFGNAIVRKPKETLRADYILLDLKKRLVIAKGNCTYFTDETHIRSDEIHFSLDTAAGSIIAGTVTNGKFKLSGDRINKLGDKRFQTHNAEYTTCQDCPGSWTMTGSDVDLEFGGYAYMENVTIKVKDAPLLWFPYLIIPLKTERESGLLFPMIGTGSSHGIVYVQPFFWNLGPSADMTFGLGTYSARGLRAEIEGRYKLSDISEGQGNLFYQHDKKSPYNNRYGFNIRQAQELPLGFLEKFRFYDVSDSRYPIELADPGRGDVIGSGEPVLNSVFSLSHSSDNISGFFELQRSRNLLNFAHPDEFDPATVQLIPRVAMTTNSRSLFGSPVIANLNLGLSNFSRSSNFYDKEPTNASPEFTPGVDPVRKATRFFVNPITYVTLNPGEFFALTPRFEYRGYIYQFPQSSLPNLTRGYLLFQTDFTFDMFKIWDTGLYDIPKKKHVIRPLIRYSLIPYVNEPIGGHDFLRQIDAHKGYNFDNQDIVPISVTKSTETYFVPLGHSLTYGVTSQWIRRRGAVDEPGAWYEIFAELRAAQTMDIREITNEDNKAENELIPFSRYDMAGYLSLDQFKIAAQYFFYPYLGRLRPDIPAGDRSPHTLSMSSSFLLESSTRQEILLFQRSFDLSYTYSHIGSRTSYFTVGSTYSLSDYIMPSLTVAYDFNQHRVQSIIGNVTFQSPSRCWKFTLTAANSVERGLQFSINGILNITGEGFSGVDSVTDQVIKR